MKLHCTGIWTCIVSLAVCSAWAGKREMLDLTQEAIQLPSNEQARKIELYTRALKEYKGFYLPWTNRAVCYLNYGKWDEAIADATEAINLSPTEPHAFGVRGRAYAGKRLFDQAFRDLSRAVELAKNDEDTRNLLNDRGNAYFSARKYEQAIKDYQKAIDVDSSFAQGYNNLGIAYRAVGDMDRAIQNLNSAVRFDAVSPRALVNRGRVFLARNDPMMAREDFNRAVDLDTKDASSLLNRGMFFFVNGEKEKALQDFEGALLAEPNNAYAAIWRYLSTSALTSKEAAKEALTETIKKQKETASWPWPIAMTLAGQSTPEETIKAAPLAGDDTRTKERLAEAHYYLGQNFIVQGDEAQGKKNLRASIEQAVPRSQEFVLAGLTLDGWKAPVPPPPRPVPSAEDLRLR
ncbi:tetratricopeptide repeat protein [bacterium]|nr:tetratricopeptide repeat protein [bacterium]